jgi:hypothetical protein
LPIDEETSATSTTVPGADAPTTTAPMQTSTTVAANTAPGQ